MKITEKIAYYQLQRKTMGLLRKAEIPPPNKLKKVGVVWRPEEKEAFKYLHDQFSHTKIIIRNLCIYDGKVPPSNDSSIITQKDLNWLGLPVSVNVEDFIKTEFDLLLNVSLQQNLVLHYITALSRARFKIGWSPEERNYFDLNINIGAKQDALYLAKQQIFYLAQLNKTKTDE